MRGQVRQQILALDRQITVPPRPVSASGSDTLQTINLPGIKECLLELLYRLLSTPAVQDLPQRHILKELAGNLAADRFFIVLWGPFSSGKSTFLNALMQESLLPARDKPTTACFTRLHYGPEKRAVARFPLQVTLPTCHEREGHLYLCRDGLAALTGWLKDKTFLSALAGVEVSTGGPFYRVDLSGLEQMLQQTGRIFAPSPFFPLLPGLRDRAAGPARPLPLSRAGRAVKTVRLTFKDAATRTFNLSDPVQRDSFHRLVSSGTALRLEAVDIYHPAPLFQLATFVDTPGMDREQARHLPVLYRWLEQCDVQLVFFNGRHILTETHRQVIWQTPPLVREEWAENCFFVVNFSDTLNRLERERVVNYLRRELARPGNTQAYRLPVHLISSLDALQGRDDGSFQRLLHHLERAILTRRGERMLIRRVNRIRELLLEMSGALDAAGGYLAKKYLEELEEIARMLRRPGGYRQWKTPACWKKG
ncbi:MAG: dynamin family protein [Thermoanaerobacteraceae bacterium]|nr:dynamin family protein [Thermoanaerobacteraceae bacterium]